MTEYLILFGSFAGGIIVTQILSSLLNLPISTLMPGLLAVVVVYGLRTIGEVTSYLDEEEYEEMKDKIDSLENEVEELKKKDK